LRKIAYFEEKLHILRKIAYFEEKFDKNAFREKTNQKISVFQRKMALFFASKWLQIKEFTNEQNRNFYEIRDVRTPDVLFRFWTLFSLKDKAEISLNFDDQNSKINIPYFVRTIIYVPKAEFPTNNFDAS
jgi:hypothetical protein